MENEKVIAELLQRIKTLESRCDRYEKRSELFEEQFRQTCKDVQEINFNVVTILKLFDKLESRLNKDQEILHGRIGSLKRDFEEYQMKDLKELQTIISNEKELIPDEVKPYIELLLQKQ